MSAYGNRFNFAELTSSEWGFVDDEKVDVESFSPPFSTISPSQFLRPQLAAPEIEFMGERTIPLFANVHCSDDSHQSYEFMPWNNQVGQVFCSAQLEYLRFNKRVSVMYNQPPISDAVELGEDGFCHLHHTPTFLPPRFFTLSPPPTLPNSTLSPETPQSPTRHEEGEEYTDQASEDFMSPSAVPELTDDLSDGCNDEGDYQKCGEKYPGKSPLTILFCASSDTGYDKTAPYAVLIHRALMSTPERRMVLAEIYEYFRENLPRTKKLKGRGWMNSVRHNLSMNGAFLKVERPHGDPGKGYIWVLSEEAIKNGVRSTTRYRKSPPNSKKRATDDTGKRRRKLTKKWTTTKSHAYTQPTVSTIKDKSNLTPPTPPHNTPVVLSEEVHPVDVHTVEVHPVDLIDYSQGLNAAHECHPIDYANCYASFPHFGASNTLYDSEDEDWRLYGPETRFNEEYALITQN